jgi:hypothetical protein
MTDWQMPEKEILFQYDLRCGVAVKEEHAEPCKRCAIGAYLREHREISELPGLVMVDLQRAQSRQTAQANFELLSAVNRRQDLLTIVPKTVR